MLTKYTRLIVGLAVAVILTVPAVLLVQGADVVPLPDVVEADGRMGTGYAFYTTSEQELPPYAKKAGSRWDRFDFRWSSIEDPRGNFNFGPHEYLVDLDAASDLDVIAILGSTAPWAASCTSSMDALAEDTTSRAFSRYTGSSSPLGTDDSIWWRACPPVNLHLAWDHPDNYWGTFVYQTVSHFKDKIHVWEIWNEPDWDVFWTGSAADYAQLLKVGYQAVKAADPTATVLFGGLAYHFEPNFYKDVFDQLVLLGPGTDQNYYFDALSLHLYSDVYNISVVASSIKNNMLTRVGLHPIWLTEIGVPLWDERPGYPGIPYDNAATVEEAAAFVIQAYAESRRAGIEKFIFFRMHDEAMGEAFGLMRNDLSYRPSYVAYQVAARYLRGENQITGPFTNNGVRRITYWGTPHGRIDILWNTAGGSAVEFAHPAILPTATLVDKRGVTQTLTAVNGTFTVTLQPATANTGVGGKYIIGGPPVLLIQHDTTPPQSALHALPAITYGSTVTLTWDVSDAQSGPWYLEVDRAATATGSWTNVLGWGQTQGTNQATLTAEEGTWYFRARARDNAGNWEAWPSTAEAWTTVNLSRTLSLSLSTYVDANSNHSKDPGESPPVQPVTMKLMKASGEVVAQSPGHIWNLVQELREGDYFIQIWASGLLPDVMPLEVHAGPDVMVVSEERGLIPVAAEAFVPLMLRH